MTDIADRLRAAVADRYDLERELGSGGMATVYLARDRRQDRPVAMKVLRADLAASLGAGRFSREIAISARLAHPNILPLYDSGESGGFLWYTMPFVEGESLRERLRREKQLPLEDAVGIACETADALAHAHAHGIVHRDIKPENILLEAGHAVVADFGVARAISAAGTDAITRTGLAVGTPLYMSPEQAAGARDVDGRSDQYSLGCVLYEMLAGDPPFTASTPQAIIARKLNEPLPRISVVREVVPPEVEAALQRSLARVPADRFRSVADFAAALRGRVATPPPTPVPAARGRVRRLAARTVAALVLLAAAAVLGRLALGVVRASRAARTYGDAPRWGAWKGWSGESFPVVAVADSLLIVGPQTREVEVFDGRRWTPARVPDGFSLRPRVGPVADGRLFAVTEAGGAEGAAASQYWWLTLSPGGLRPTEALPASGSQPNLPSWWSDGRDLVAYTHSIRRLEGGAWVAEPMPVTGFVRTVWGRDADHRFALVTSPEDSLLVFDGIGWRLVDPLGGSAPGRRVYTAGATFGDGTTVVVGDECDAQERCRPLILEQDRFGDRWRRVAIPRGIGIPVTPRRDTTGACDSPDFALTGVAGRSRDDWVVSGTWSACEQGRWPRLRTGCPPGQPCVWQAGRDGLRPVADLVGRQVAAAVFADSVTEALADDGTLWRRVGGGWRAVTRVPGLPFRLVGASQRLVVRATGGVVRYEPGRGDTLSAFFTAPLRGFPPATDAGAPLRQLVVRDTTAVALTDDGRVLVSRCRMVRIGAGPRDSELRCLPWAPLPPAGARVEAIAVLAGGTVVGVGGAGLAVSWSGPRPTRERLPPAARGDSLWAVVATADGGALAIGTTAVVRRDARGAWAPVRPWRQPPNERGRFAALPDGDLVTAGWAVRVWDRSPDTLPVRTLYGPAPSELQVSALHVLPDGRLVAGLASPPDRILGGRLIVWADPARAGREQPVDLPLDLDVTDLADDGEYLYVAGRGGSLAIALDALPFARPAPAPPAPAPPHAAAGAAPQRQQRTPAQRRQR